MARDTTVSGIDVGTSKITTLIAAVGEEDDVRVIGVSTVPSRGLRKGQVVNIDEATQAISQSLESAERMAGASVGRAFVSVGGSHIASLNSHGVVAVAEPDKEISENDVKRVIEAAKLSRFLLPAKFCMYFRAGILWTVRRESLIPLA